MIEFFASMLNATWALLTIYYIPVLIFYVLGGVAYTILKWYFDIFKLRVAILNSSDIKDLEVRLENTADKQIYSDILESIENVKKRLSNESFDGYSYPPQLSDHKAELFFRALFWPINLVWLLIGEIAIDLWIAIYLRTAKIFQSISDAILP